MLLDFARPQLTELEPNEMEALENHLLDCPACARLARDERRMDEHIGQAMRNISIPSGLRDRLVKKLTEPAPVPARRFGRAAWSLAAAASLIGVIWTGAVLATRPKPVDVNQVVADNYSMLNNPRRENVDDWLHANRLTMPAPEVFNYSMLRHYGMANLQGQPVPMLLFIHGAQQARVYLLDGRKFNLEELRAAQADDSSGCKVEFVPHPTNQRFGYLVVHNANDLALFRDDDGTQLSANQS
jgi:hypothetical protein